MLQHEWRFLRGESLSLRPASSYRQHCPMEHPAMMEIFCICTIHAVASSHVWWTRT